ncbi:MAG TPA: DeoR family transcriptional regulator [Bacillales bacterium]|nr:DeoR family transcriptional regulator [Bacillales bacterium]
MLPAERRKRIEEWVRKQGHLKISTLSKQLGVSEMTIHRDIKPLVDEGLVVKTFGGISLARGTVAKREDNDCVYCRKWIDKRLAYRLIYADGTVEKTCCAHCGLLRQLQLPEETQFHAICRDFLKNTTISASWATYVCDTSLNMGCCQPQLLPFEFKDEAKKFVKGFGGKLMMYEDVLDKMRADAKVVHCPSHRKGDS